jgi:hypothetical protein
MAVLTLAATIKRNNLVRMLARSTVWRTPQEVSYLIFSGVQMHVIAVLLLQTMMTVVANIRESMMMKAAPKAGAKKNLAAPNITDLAESSPIASSALFKLIMPYADR